MLLSSFDFNPIIMDSSLDGKVYFRPLRKVKTTRPLEELVYTANDTNINYHQRLLGARHSCRRKYWKNAPISSHIANGQPRNLYSLCIDFVSYSLDIVDSFLGLPSLIGEEIFNVCLANEQLSLHHFDHDVMDKRVGLFFEAYGDEMLESVNLSGEWKFTACYLDQISILLPYVTTIELCHCRIGNQHDILHELGKLHVAKKIDLSDNDISNDGIKYFLQTHRRAKCGLENLEILLLARNYELTDAFLPHIQTLPKLKVISISVTCLRSSDSEHSQFSRTCRHGICHTSEVAENTSGDVSSKWGSKLISHWLDNFKSNEIDKKLQEEKRKSGSVRTMFYKKEEAECSKASAKSLTTVFNHKTSDSLIMCSCGFKGPQQSDTLKRKRPMPKQNIISKMSKRRKSDIPQSKHSPNDHEFDDLFELYGK